MIAVALVVAATLTTDPPAVHNGRRHELDVRPPRVAADIVVDGRLDEPVWKQAAILTGFSRYAPTDGAPADDSTDVLVWYSATAIHFGIRAYAERGTVNATLADRDKIYNDDYVGIFLGTFNDGRQAMVFAVNPLGVQGDGMVVERGAGSSGFGGLQTGREATDIAPDFVFESKGRVTEYGYEVEIRIPFKSLRYQSGATQTWGLNVMRRVQSRGVEYSWAPAQRAAASYVGQFGRLNGGGQPEQRRGCVPIEQPGGEIENQRHPHECPDLGQRHTRVEICLQVIRHGHVHQRAGERDKPAASHLP